MEIPTRSEVESIKRMYPTGTVIELDHMNDPQAPPSGTCGKVISVDDMGHLQMHWKTGSSLALIPKVDKFHKIK